VINQNEKKEIQMRVTATKENIGHIVAKVNIIKYPGLLPAEIIAMFTKISIPLTMFLVSCFPVGIITLTFYGVDRKIGRK
jgi:hypothetical protein